MEKIETTRLILRNFKDEDYDDLYEFLSQRKDDIYEAYPGITYENGKEHLKYRIDNDEFIALVLKEKQKVIGNIYMGNRDFEAKETGYIINKKYQRMGYASEALNVIIQKAFKKNIHRIYAECAPQNTCSWKLLEHLGFTREACFRQNVYFHKDEKGNPIWQDTYVYCLLQNDVKEHSLLNQKKIWNRCSGLKRRFHIQ